MSPPPRWATPRSPDRFSFGPEVGRIARGLGVPPMPWQQQVLDVALEVVRADNPRGWAWAYRTVVVTVQRQAGKTGGLLTPLHVHRALKQPRSTYLTAQTGKAARDVWADAVKKVKRTPLAGVVDIRESNGSETIDCPSGGSFRIFPPTADALHGRTNELVSIDEAWTFTEAEGADLLAAIGPTFSTTGGQLWMVSTAGDGSSTWFRRVVDRGRDAVETGQREGTAYFEWSIDGGTASAVAAGLDGGSPSDRDGVLAALLAQHPGHGRTLDASAVRAMADTMTVDAFLRGYGNVWTASADQVIPDHVWQACLLDRPWTPPAPGAMALAFDVAMDRSSATIGVAWRETPTGPLLIDVLDQQPGDDWIVPRLRELSRTWQPADIAHTGGPALAVADECNRSGLPVRQLTFPEYATGCATFLTAARNRRLAHADRPSLNAAVAGAATKQLGDAWVWSRRTSAVPIDPLNAVTAAGYAYDHRPAPAARPVIAVTRHRTPGVPNVRWPSTAA